MKVQIITPHRLAREIDAVSVTLPTASGEITILPRHQSLVSLMVEGIVTLRTAEGEDTLSVGGGYVQTDGSMVRVLVSHSAGQDEVDEKSTLEAIAQAQKVLAESSDTAQIERANAVLRRSIIDAKLIKRHRQSRQP